MNNSPQDSEQALQKFKQNQASMQNMGRRIVFVIAAANAIFSFFSFFQNWNIISLIVQVVLSVALFCGVAWVRYLFIIGSVLGVVVTIAVLPEIMTDSRVPAGLIILLAANVAFAIASAVLLLANKGVREFLYSQKNG